MAFKSTLVPVLTACAVLVFGGAASLSAPSAIAAEKPAGKDPKPNAKKAPPKAEGGDTGGVGYGGGRVQLAPIMSPYRDGGGRLLYQVVSVRLVLDVGVNERPACFMAPVVQEKFLMYLSRTQPQPDDFKGQRKDVMQKSLLDIATQASDRGYYSGVELVDDSTPPLDPKSQTLSTQCRQ